MPQDEPRFDVPRADDLRLNQPDLDDLTDAWTLVDDEFEVMDGSTNSSWLDRALDRWGRKRIHRGVIAAAVTVSMLAVVVGLPAFVGNEPRPDRRLLSAPVSLESVINNNDATVTATLLVRPARGNVDYRVTSLSGPFLTRTGQSLVRDLSAGNRSAITVAPDCDRWRALTMTAGDYAVAVTRIDPDGTTLAGDIPVQRPGTSVGDSIRRACWKQGAATRLPVTRVVTTLDRTKRLLLLEATVRNKLPIDVRVEVADIADVSTIDPADVQVIPAGDSRALRVRVPIADCAHPAWPWPADPASTDPGMALAWGVGPDDEAPQVLTTATLSTTQTAVVRRAIAQLCHPPGTDIAVTGVRLLDARPDVGATGIRTAIDLLVRSTASRLDLGYDFVGLTADARVPIEQVVATTRAGVARVTVVWDATCDQSTPPPILPVGLGSASDRPRWSVSLDAPEIARAYTAACGLDRFNSAQWDVTRS